MKKVLSGNARQCLNLKTRLRFSPAYMDTLKRTGQNLTRVFNSRNDCVCAIYTCWYWAKQPNLELKTWPKQLLSCLLLDLTLPGVIRVYFAAPLPPPARVPPRPRPHIVPPRPRPALIIVDRFFFTKSSVRFFLIAVSTLWTLIRFFGKLNGAATVGYV
jgi:hypothetical protein